MSVVLRPVKHVVTLRPENRAPVLLGSLSAAPRVVLDPNRGPQGIPGPAPADPGDLTLIFDNQLL